MDHSNISKAVETLKSHLEWTRGLLEEEAAHRDSLDRKMQDSYERTRGLTEEFRSLQAAIEKLGGASE